MCGPGYEAIVQPPFDGERWCTNAGIVGMDSERVRF